MIIIKEPTTKIPYRHLFYEDSKGMTWKYRVTKNFGEELGKFYIKNTDKYISNGCFIISAYRGENDEKANKENTYKLAEDIRSHGLGYIHVLGDYSENETKITGESFFVPQPENISDNEFFDIATGLCGKYNQDSVLISMPECSDKNFGYYDKTGRFDFSPSEDILFTDESVKQYFSALFKGSNCKWLAVRNPGSVYQAVLMDRNKENLLFKL